MGVLTNVHNLQYPGMSKCAKRYAGQTVAWRSSLLESVWLIFVQHKFHLAEMDKCHFSTELSTHFGENKSVKNDRHIEIKNRSL
jgi:hypothetical protein